MQIETKTEIAILISDKINFKLKTITRDKEGHYKMIKRSTYKEDMTIINMYEPNIRSSKYIKQILTDLKGEIETIL